MLLNGIKCGGFVTPQKDVVEFSLAETTIAAASALDGADLAITEDDGETVVASFKGYEVTGVWESNGAVRLRAARALEADSKAAIEALETNLASVTAKVDDVEEDVADVSAASADTLQAVGELGVDSAALQQSTAEILQAIGELGAMVAAMSAEEPTEPTE